MRGGAFVAVLAAITAACGSGSSVAPVASPPDLSTGSTTSAPATSSTTSAPGTSVAGANETVFLTLGPLANPPNIVIDAPSWNDGMNSFVERSFGALVQVPGGVVVGVSSRERSDVVLVDFDGTVRWRRNFDDQVSFLAPEDPTGIEQVLVWRSRGNDPGIAEVLDLRDGSSSTPGGLLGVGDGGGQLRFLAGRVFDDKALLRPMSVDGSIPPDVPWRTIDLRTFEQGAMPAPAQGADDVAVLSDGRLASTRQGTSGNFPAVVGVLVGSQWEAVGDLSGVWIPGMYRWQGDDPDGHTYPAVYGADGTQWWARKDLTIPGGELVAAKAIGDVVISSVCSAPSCDSPSLVGLDLLTGETRWTQPDYGFVAAGADGLALVDTAGPPVAAVVRTDTGEVLAGQVFPGGGWPEGCCADPSTTVISGGVVFAAGETLIRIYLPADSSVAPPVRLHLSE